VLIEIPPAIIIYIKISKFNKDMITHQPPIQLQLDVSVHMLRKLETFINNHSIMLNDLPLPSKSVCQTVIMLNDLPLLMLRQSDMLMPENANARQSEMLMPEMLMLSQTDFPLAKILALAFSFRKT